MLACTSSCSSVSRCLGGSLCRAASDFAATGVGRACSATSTTAAIANMHRRDSKFILDLLLSAPCRTEPLRSARGRPQLLAFDQSNTLHSRDDYLRYARTPFDS